MSKCPQCGTEMKALFTSLYCPTDHSAKAGPLSKWPTIESFTSWAISYNTQTQVAVAIRNNTVLTARPAGYDWVTFLAGMVYLQVEGYAVAEIVSYVSDLGVKVIQAGKLHNGLIDGWNLTI